MKKLLFITMLFIGISTFAQETKHNVDPSYKFFFKETTLETDDYKIYIEDAMAVDAWTKFKIRIFNKTNDYLIFKPTDVIFKINGQEVPGTDKQVIVQPNDEATKVIDAKAKGCQVDKYTVEVKNVYKVAANAPAIKAEDFNIPFTSKEFSAGNFSCAAKSAAIKTDKSLIKFLCTYNGDGVGILAPTKITAVMPKGQDNPNTNRNKGTLLERGKSDDFMVEIKELAGSGDMQKEKFQLRWNDTFKESKMETLKGGNFTLEFDQPKTAEKNK